VSDLYPVSDPLNFADVLTPAEQSAIRRLRATLETKVKPLVNEYWARDEFPAQIVPDLVGLRMMNPTELVAVGETPGHLFAGFRTFELARCDTSIATFYNAVAGLFRATITLGGSPEQVAAWDPLVQSFEMFGVFCLTEPEHGSDIARGLSTTATRTGDTWTINGAKRWIGGAGMANTLAVFARDTADGEVKVFLVPQDAPGVTLTKMEGKIALRIMQNFDIMLNDVQVSDDTRLANVKSFADVARLLGNTRSIVAWIACGAMAGAYEAAVRYTTERDQFGKKIAHFQLVQEKLAAMLANVTASLAMTVRLAQREAAGAYTDENSAMTKMFTSLKLRETVALAREVAGGNGILLENDVARFFADAEAVYSYEGTHEINSLVVGRAITGKGAFV
jgi:glutaryl-CoA dehydrogenase